MLKDLNVTESATQNLLCEMQASGRSAEGYCYYIGRRAVAGHSWGLCLSFAASLNVHAAFIRCQTRKLDYYVMAWGFTLVA